ncbi:tRNA glutamyl-Q(34) synthetase GluQRS [Sagittula sp. NFXS13]|uniref:tRNA glutamyl-Q(34) synthetase GluQRS n=1 Tax=Sagittula sp. NFXS13 TaxID=2819095 RepID=UPI0032E04EA6
MKTRFAPSPTGPLHLGHAYSALLAFDMAQAAGGRFLLRIDDLDLSRARPEWEQQIYDDLHWLGLHWPTPCRRESNHMADYDAALDQLWDMGLLYPCGCTRRDIREALSAPQDAPREGPDGLIYPGTCRPDRPLAGPRPKNQTLRLNMDAAMRHVREALPLTFTESGAGLSGETGEILLSRNAMINNVGDVVLSRRDAGAAYHLAVVVDDAAQGITHVVRGADLFDATRIHVLLQTLLDVATPRYHHHMLIRDDHGKRLAKRDDARAIAVYRAEGMTPEDIRQKIGL